LKLRGVTRNNLDRLDVDIPLGVFTSVTGISGSGKSSLISQFLVETVTEGLGQLKESNEDDDGLERAVETVRGEITEGLDKIRRLVVVDQKPIGRTPRSNLATYTGLFDHVRKLFAATKHARARRYDAGRFSFNVAKGRCETCQGGRVRMRRTSFSSERVRAVSDMQGSAVQRQDARNQDPGPVDC
jgi:excinuclease ABC subunit A